MNCERTRKWHAAPVSGTPQRIELLRHRWLRRLALVLAAVIPAVAGAASLSPREMRDVVLVPLRARRFEEARALLSRMETASSTRCALDAFERALVAGELARARATVIADSPLAEERFSLLLELMRQKGSSLDELVACLDLAAARYPQLTSFWFQRFQLLEGAGRDSEALAGVDAALKPLPTVPELHLARARLLSRLGRHLEALQSLQRAREQGADIDSIESQEVGLLIDSGRRPEALKRLSAMRNRRLSGEAAQLLAHGLCARKEWSEAGAWLEVALARGHDSAHNRLLLAQARLNCGDRAGSQAALASFRAGDLPRESGAHFLMAEILSRHGRAPEALTQQELGVALKPTDVPQQLTLARMQVQAGRASQALRTLARLLQSKDLSQQHRLQVVELSRSLTEKADEMEQLADRLSRVDIRSGDRPPSAETR